MPLLENPQRARTPLLFLFTIRPLAGVTRNRRWRISTYTAVYAHLCLYPTPNQGNYPRPASTDSPRDTDWGLDSEGSRLRAEAASFR